jgi:hypothetical protein
MFKTNRSDPVSDQDQQALDADPYANDGHSTGSGSTTMVEQSTRPHKDF